MFERIFHAPLRFLRAWRAVVREQDRRVAEGKCAMCGEPDCEQHRLETQAW